MQQIDQPANRFRHFYNVNSRGGKQRVTGWIAAVRNGQEGRAFAWHTSMASLRLPTSLSVTSRGHLSFLSSVTAIDVRATALDLRSVVYLCTQTRETR